MSGKIIITGADGFIGSHLLDYFINKGLDAIGVLRSKTIDSKDNLITNNEVGLKNIINYYKPDVIINCAGKANVGFSREHPEVDYEANYLFPRNLLEDVRINCPRCRVILFSSAAVYGNPQSLPIKENAVAAPISPYALHKTIMEETAFYYNRVYNIDVVILRVFSAYGRGLKKQLLWDMISKSLTNSEILLSGTGNESRDFIHIDDIVRAVYLILFRSQSKDIVYNVANGKQITISEVSDIFSSCFYEITKRDLRVCFDGSIRRGDPSNWCADILRLKKVGYSQKVDFAEGVRDYIKWTKEEGII